jgi:DNA modification methylase
MPKKKNASGANEPSKWRSKIVGHEKVQAGQLMANPFNHRRHPEKQRKVVAASINELGFIKSVIVNQLTGHIVDGHERVMQALGVGEETLVDVEYVELSPEDEKKALLILDASSELAEVDASSLDQLVKDCAFDMGVLDDLAKEMLADFPMVDEPKITEDDIPEPPVDPITKPGDLWVLGDHRLLCGDSTNTEDVARLLNGSQGELCFTSPPYALGKSVSMSGNKKMSASENPYTEHKDDSDSWIDLMRGWFSASTKAVSDVWIINIQPLAGNKRDLMRFMAENADRLVDIVTWDKGHAPPAPSTGVMASRFEWMIIFSTKNNASRSIPKSSWRGTIQNVYSGDPQRNNDFSSIHAATMPMHVPIWIMQSLCDQAQSVYEPFCGTGTTLIAAEQLGRKCCAMEISPQYCDVVVKRWENLTNKKAFLEQRNTVS